MNGLKAVQIKADYMSSLDQSVDTENILLHVQRAILFYENGMQTNDEQYFTDVIYRCNQAFEGCSRTAYKLLSDKTFEEVKKVKAWQIEKYLEEEGILNDRVLPLFNNYRNKWRNESAHNYELFFSENEGFVAISNVISYLYVLFNQIIYKLSQNNLAGDPITIPSQGHTKKKEGTLIRTLTSELVSFFSDARFEGLKLVKGSPTILEVQIVASFSSYLQVLYPEFIIEHEKKVGEDGFIVDLIVRSNKEEVALEFKRHTKISVNNGEFQLLNLINRSTIKNGILVVYDASGKSYVPTVKSYSKQLDGVVYSLATVLPS